MGLSEIRIEGHRPLEHRHRQAQGGLAVVGGARGLEPAQVRLVGLEDSRRRRLDALPGRRQQRHVELRDHALRDLRLRAKQVVQHPVVLLRPDVRVVGDADQLGRDQHPLDVAGAVPANRALQHVVDTQLAGDLLHGSSGSRVMARARARDHAQLRHGGQPAADLLGHPVGEVLVGRWTEVLEREDRDQDALVLRW